MNYSRLRIFACPRMLFILLLQLSPLFAPPCWAQKGEGYNDLATPQVRSGKLAGPEHLRNYVVNGKLTLSLRDAVVLTLENNSFVRIQEAQVEFSKFSLLGAHAPFDPLLTSYYNVNSSTFSAVSQLQGAGTSAVNSTTQNAQ